MLHVLDNMIWNAITSGNKDIAVVDGDIGYYRPDIAPFAGMREFTKANIQKLYEFIPANAKVAISSLNKMEHNTNKWKLLQPMDVTQMIYEYPVDSFKTKTSDLIIPLTDQHIPQMLELTALTK